MNPTTEYIRLLGETLAARHPGHRWCEAEMMSWRCSRCDTCVCFASGSGTFYDTKTHRAFPATCDLAIAHEVMRS